MARAKNNSVDKKKLNGSMNSSESWVTKSFKYPNATIRLATLFSGIGAIEFALRRLNLKSEIVFACDNDKFVKESYFANYDIDESRWFDDATTLYAGKFKDKIDLLVGGAPCQSFSMVGKRRNLLDDTRGTLFYDFARVVQDTKPKVFIFENVAGILNHDKKRTWAKINEVFESLDYKCFSETLNGRDFGIPQNRKRVFLIGFLDKKTEFEFPEPIKLKYTMQDFLEDYTDTKYYLKEKGVKFVTSTKNRKKRYTQINGEIMLCQKANQQFNWHGDFVYDDKDKKGYDDFIFDVSKVEEKYFLSDKVKKYVLSQGTKNFKTSTKTDLKVARALLSTMHKMHRAGVDNYITYEHGKIRKLTPRECLRLMGFTDDFKIAVSDTQMYRQTGNSIIVDVLIAILKQIDITSFSEKSSDGKD